MRLSSPGGAYRVGCGVGDAAQRQGSGGSGTMTADERPDAIAL
jgi:hypothetical protein